MSRSARPLRLGVLVSIMALVLSVGLLPASAGSAADGSRAALRTAAPSPTRLSGFIKTRAAVRVAGELSNTVTVMPRAARTVTVQYRRAGAKRFTNASVGKASPQGRFDARMKPPAAGAWQFRLLVAASRRAKALASPVRPVKASGRATTTKLNGFVSTAATVTVGGAVNDSVIVTPKTARTVQTQSRRAGAGTFVTATTGKSSKAGAFKAVYRPTQAGVWQYRLVVRAIATARTATSPTRTVTATSPPVTSPPAVTPVLANLTAAEVVAAFNLERVGSGLPPVTENTTWSANCRKHNEWMALNKVLAHPETPGSPGYSKEGNWAGTHSVLASGAAWRRGDPWRTAPIHLSQMMSPLLASVGTDESSGYNCLTTWPGYMPATAPPGTLTWFPGQGVTVPALEVAAESPSVPGTWVGIPERTATGPYLYLYAPGVQATFVYDPVGGCDPAAPSGTATHG